MKITGSNVVPFPVETVWDAILDPRVLVATIPGCEQLAATGENAYDMTVTAGVAAIKGTYQGSCTLSDLKDNESLVMRLIGRRRARHHRRDRPGLLRRGRAGRHQDRLRGRRRRRRHGRRRRPADADLGLQADGRRVLRQRRLRDRQGPAPPVDLHAVAAAPVESAPDASGAQVFTAPAKAPPSRRRTTSSRASPSVPGWSCSASSVGRLVRARRSHADSVSILSVDSTARDQAAAVRRREISARELLDLHLARIGERNPELNAIVSLDEERARAGRRCGRRGAGVRGRGRGAARAAVRVQGHPRRGAAGARRTARRSSPTTSPSTTT